MRGEKTTVDNLGNLMPEVYDQLRFVARNMVGYGGAGNRTPTLGATALVHEAWARLAASGIQPNDKQHLLALASRVLRQVLIDYVRTKGRHKRGGDVMRLHLDEAITAAQKRSIDLLELDEVLTRLADFGPRQAQVVEMRFFGSLTPDEIAGVLGVSRRTVENDWAAARSWLYGQLSSATS
ncbi:MAG: sigma-70 family RNA polymerase sigma factor [Planctomycetes bacterium]|nr:sigma-70 family RNA polymerase sigma factor [Planctomycetota bacterium]NOG52865.1 sigma-70 family RNA polymerase sigma factor [Planctomycetota bacterium]